MSVNVAAIIMCWFLVMFDCNCFLYANVNSTNEGSFAVMSFSLLVTSTHQSPASLTAY